MSVETAIFERQSIRRFRPDPVPPDAIARLIAAAGRAPSAHNRQPWRFRIVADTAEKARLALSMGQRLEEDRSRDGDDPAAIQQDVERSSARINGAPALVAVCLTLEEMDTYPDQRRNGAEYLMAVQSTAMATQNLLLTAHAEGLGTCWMCAPLFCADAVKSALVLPASWQPQGLVLLGYAAEPGRSRPRKASRDISIGLSK